MKKQEEAVGEKPEEETVEQCIARVKTENPEISDEDARAKCTNKPAPEPEGEAEKGLKTQILAVMKEYGNTLAVQIKKDIQEKMDVVVKETRDEMVQSLRKGLGLEKDPVIHLSEMEDVVRKILVEEKPHGKRTLTETSDKPIEGAKEEPKKLEKSDDMFNKMMKNKGGL